VFVARNLAAGTDHMLLFLDDPDEELRSWQPEHVTLIATDEAYWDGARPERLNERQRVNANVANTALAPFERVGWLFHLDGDECLDIDLDVLSGVEPGFGCVRLAALEAVSRREWPGEVTHFKQLLDYEQLCLLHAVGVIDAPTNRSLFNGHVAGKVGVRPSPHVVVEIHTARDGDGNELETAHIEGLHVLHFESWCEAEFVRKWEAHLGSGGANFRAEKDRLRGAVEAIATNAELDDAGRRRYLAEVYTRLVEDDFDRLVELGFAVTVDAARHRHTPVPFTAEESAGLAWLLGRLVAVDKGRFAAPARAARELIGELAADAAVPDDLRTLLSSCLDRALTPSVVTSWADLARDF
jgi:hypothetical protein